LQEKNNNNKLKISVEKKNAPPPPALPYLTPMGAVVSVGWELNIMSREKIKEGGGLKKMINKCIFDRVCCCIRCGVKTKRKCHGKKMSRKKMDQMWQ